MLSTDFMSTDDVGMEVEIAEVRRKRKTRDVASSEEMRKGNEVRAKKGESSKRQEENERRRLTRRRATETEESDVAGREELRRIEEGIRKKEEREVKARKERDDKEKKKREEEGRRQQKKRKGGDKRRRGEREGAGKLGRETGQSARGDGQDPKIDQQRKRGQISVTKMDQMTVKDAVILIQKNILAMARDHFRVRLELERVKGQVRAGKKDERGRVVSEEAKEGKQATVRQRRTYAQVSPRKTSDSEGDKIEGRVVVVGKEGWRTPPTRKTKATALVITSREERDSRKVADEIAKKVTAKEIGGAPQVVRKIRDGRLVIVPKDDEQKQRIQKNLSDMTGLEVRESKGTEPLVLISGVTKGLTDDEFLEKLKRGMEGMEETMEGEVKIVRRINCRNNWKENVLVSMGVNNFKRVVKRGKVEIDCVLHFAEEYLGVAQCFRCCRFGHVMKYCKEKQVCHKCMGEHV